MSNLDEKDQVHEVVLAEQPRSHEEPGQREANEGHHDELEGDGRGREREEFLVAS